MRNITARWASKPGTSVYPAGAVSYSNTGGQSTDSGIELPQIFLFNANTDNEDYGNSMAGHANGDDIHPYSFRTLFLIAY